MSGKGDPGSRIERVEFDVKPHTSLMPKLGLGGYTTPQAIAELVDNSIDARIDGERLHVTVSIDARSITVTDDGTGMDETTIRRALRLADSDKEDKLGMFGMGLKTACTSLGSRFDVRTSPEGDEAMYHTWFDEDEWSVRASDEWKLLLETEPKKDLRIHGTEVMVTRLRVKTTGLVTRLRKDLAQRYRPYIQSGEVEIKVNMKKCGYTRPELMEGTREEFELDVRGGRIWGWYGLLKHGSKRGLYGFHTFRRGRTITTYDKIGIPEGPTVSRITGEIHLNHVPVTYDKREFIKESSEYQEAEELLEKEFEDLVRRAREAAAPERLTPRVMRELDEWKAFLQEALNTPELAGYRLPAGVRFETVDPHEVPTAVPREVEIEERKPPTGSTEHPPESRDEQDREAKKTHPATRNTIRIRGRKFEYTQEFRSLGLESPWKEYTIDENRRLIIIYTNTDFPSYSITRDLPFYTVIHIAESLAEIMVEQSGESKEKVGEVKEAILRASSRIANQVRAQREI
ncbi:MAG: ATP-binding protein [Thermoplasmata archaeon]